MMTIHQMRIFVMVYQNRNITKAAQRLNMTQPAVSRSIAELEAFYKVRLFERINHRIQPTELAGRVYAQAMQIVDSFNQMEKGLKHWDEEGTLRIGASITLGNFLLPDLVARFRKTRPNLTVKVSIANASRIEQDLLEGKLDVAMVEGVADEEHLHKETFSKDHLVPIFPVGHPLLTKPRLLLEELKAEPILLRESGSAGRTFLDHIFAIHEMHVEPLWESTSTQALIKAVAKGIGISFLPEWLVEDAVGNGLIATHPLADEPLLREHYLVWHKDKYLTPTTTEFLDLCRTVKLR